jgi:predicted nucleotidyltransferase
MIAGPSNAKRQLPMQQIATFCRRWNIARLEVFGSFLRDDYGADSDVDLLATYAPEAHWSLLDRVRMKFELESLLSCRVDLLNRRALEKSGNRERAAAILAQAQPLYARP